jgi:hypothetical protein
LRRIIKEQESKAAGYGGDLDLLNDHVWPFIITDQLGHDSYSCAAFPQSVPFPTQRPRDFQHVGQVFIDGVPRKSDITNFMTKPNPKSCRRHEKWTYG